MMETKKSELKTPQPKRKNRTSWYFADKKTSISKQVWEIGQFYYNKMQDPKGRPRHRIKHSVELVKFFYWTYILGTQQQETFKQPLSLEIVHEPNRDYMNIKHSNQRHKGAEAEVLMAMPILDQYERQIWDFITNLGTLTEVEHIFQYKEWNSTKQNNIANLMNKNFITDLQNPMDGKIYKKQGIPTSILRYMRLRNLILEHQVPERILNTWFGCDVKYMASRHPDLKRQLQAMDLKEQRIALEKANLMPNFKLGIGTMPTY